MSPVRVVHPLVVREARTMALLRDNELHNLYHTLLRQTDQDNDTEVPSWVEKLTSSILYLRRGEDQHEEDFSLQLIEAGYSLGAEVANGINTYYVLNHERTYMADYALFFCTNDRDGLLQKLRMVAEDKIAEVEAEREERRRGVHDT